MSTGDLESLGDLVEGLVFVLVLVDQLDLLLLRPSFSLSSVLEGSLGILFILMLTFSLII